MSHVGSRLLAELAEATGLTAAFSDALAGLRQPRSGHDPGRVLTDLAVMLADGGRAISGPGGAAGPAGRVRPGGLDGDGVAGPGRGRRRPLDRVRAARARRGSSCGRSAPRRSGAAGVHRGWSDLAGAGHRRRRHPGRVHSEKESAAATFKGGFGFHPLLVWLDNTNEALAAVLRPGNAGSNTAADHIAVLDLALAQIPDAHRHGSPILVRADGAGATQAWLATCAAAARARGWTCEYSVGFTMTEQVQAAIVALPERGVDAGAQRRRRSP